MTEQDDNDNQSNEDTINLGSNNDEYDGYQD